MFLFLCLCLWFCSLANEIPLNDHWEDSFYWEAPISWPPRVHRVNTLAGDHVAEVSQTECRIHLQSTEPVELSLHGRWKLENRWRGESLVQSNARKTHQLAFECIEPEVVELRVNRDRFQIWVTPGAHLQIELQASELEFSGELTDQNHLLKQLGFQHSPQTVAQDNIDYPTFYATQDALREGRIHQINATKLEGPFQDYCKARTHAAFCLQLNIQPLLQQTIPNSTKIPVPSDYYKFWNQLPIFESQGAQQSYRYLQAVDSKHEYLAVQELSNSDSATVLTAQQIIDQQIKVQQRKLTNAPELQQRLLERKLLFAIDQLGERVVNQLLLKWQGKLTSKANRQFLADEFANSKPQYSDWIKLSVLSKQEKERIEKLQPASPYLIVAWGTWCKACAIDKPKLESRIKEGNIQLPIVYLNFGDDLDVWKETTAEFDNTLRLDWKATTSQSETELKRALRLQSFPGYFYIDPMREQARRLASPGTEDFLEDLEYFSKGSN